MVSQSDIAPQEEILKDFLRAEPNRSLEGSFIEQGSFKKNRKNWEALDKAILSCKANQAHLLIIQFKKVITNDAFMQRVLHFIGKTQSGSDTSYAQQSFIHNVACCDFVSINRDNFSAIVEHERRQRLEHRRRIMMGLKNPHAKKSGNPHAAQVINVVNWPKVNNAIIFALHLQPTIEQYTKEGLSQRKMVMRLNDEGFFAPEGGKWVLSQLQKVLDRIKINQAAIAYEARLDKDRADGLDLEQIAEKMNLDRIPAPLGSRWTTSLVEQVINRLEQFDDIIAFNQFVLATKPIFDKYGLDELTDPTFLAEVKERNLVIPEILKAMCIC